MDLLSPDLRRALDERGATEHYDDPARYAARYRFRAEDIAFYRDLAVQLGGPVLEYGCGSGRITLPIARAGVAITGVDRSPPMLAELERRVGREPAAVRERIASRRGDMRKLRLKRRFPLVLCTFNAFLHLYTRQDAEAFLARVRAHLARDGRFVLDVSVPSPENLARDVTTARGGERSSWNPLAQTLFVWVEGPAGSDAPASLLAQRQYFPAELEALLWYNGFTVEALAGGFAGEKPGPRSETLVWTCRARRQPPG